MNTNPIVCLMGPTASGKTTLALELVKHFPFEIISVDSAMIYRGMNIGTAKPDADILRLVPHKLIDICDPRESYSVAQFQKDARIAIQDIHERNKIPLLVGGTMMYFYGLHTGIAEMPSKDEEVRSTLIEDAKRLGWPELHKRLHLCDPDAAKRIHPHDSQRIQRALEVFIVSGKNLTVWQKSNPDEFLRLPMIDLIVSPYERAVLHARIEARFSSMMRLGFMDEVQQLFSRDDLNLALPAMRAVGYRQVWEHLQGHYSYKLMLEKAVIATRQLAKRQLTWLRQWEGGTWFDSESSDVLSQLCIVLKQKLG